MKYNSNNELRSHVDLSKCLQMYKMFINKTAVGLVKWIKFIVIKLLNITDR